MGNFTLEEMSLVCTYSTGSRAGLIGSLREMRGELSPEETELRELTDSAPTKLCVMIDEKFAELESYPDFDQQTTQPQGQGGDLLPRLLSQN